MQNKEITAAVERRERIAGKIGEGEVFLSFCGADELSVHEVLDLNQMDVNFRYLTGIYLPGAVLAIAKCQGRIQTVLFIQHRSENDEFYTGKAYTTGHYQQELGIPCVMYKESLDDFIETISMRTNLKKVWFSNAVQRPSKYRKEYNLYAEKLQNGYPGIEVGSMSGILQNMRLRKSPEEIDNIQKATELTQIALDSTVKALRPGLKEYQLYSMIEHALKMQGATVRIMVAAVGKNTTILHYQGLEEEAQDGDLFLVDLCADWNGYVNDVTRTYPVNGKFSEEQAYWYKVCLNAQKMVIDELMPGKSADQCGAKANAYLEKKFREAGYLEKGETIRDTIGFCRVNYATPAMVNHGVGLEPHEKKCDDSGMLVPGSVLAIEPGIYLGEKNIGIRIEDTVLITEDGHIVLSESIPKELDEIEAMMGGN